MTTRRDRLIIIDLEATCWVDHQPPPGEESEIIEIGLCLLDMKSGIISGKRSILIRPERSKMSEFCTKLTTLTQAELDAGISFAAACSMLAEEYEAASFGWGSWGLYDYTMFTGQCKRWGVPFPFSDTHINLKKLFSRLHDGKRRGMEGALRLAGLPLEGIHHRGDDDAWNIGRLVVYMLERFGQGIFDQYYEE